jgi:hypothetical protein
VEKSKGDAEVDNNPNKWEDEKLNSEIEKISPKSNLLGYGLSANSY